MDIDSYETPESESLLIAGRERHVEHERDRRLMITEAAGAVLFLAVAISLASFATWSRPLSLSALAVTVVAYMAAARVRFPVGSAATIPTQLAFVPMLFLLPTPLVPLIVAACMVADLWSHLARGSLSLTRVLARIGDSSYSLGPALVLVLAGHESLSWQIWPVLLLAFCAQVIFDAASGLARTWFAERIAPSEQLPMVWLYVTDACLACVGLLAAASSARRPGLVLLVLPLIGLLWLFARERQQRLDHELALSTAYRGTALLLGDMVEADDHYTGAHSRDVVGLALAVSCALRLDPARRRNVEFNGAPARRRQDPRSQGDHQQTRPARPSGMDDHAQAHDRGRDDAHAGWGRPRDGRAVRPFIPRALRRHRLPRRPRCRGDPHRVPDRQRVRCLQRDDE